MAETMAGLRANMALYGPLKALSEREAEKQFPGKATIIRPGLILGPGDETDRFTYWPLRLERGGEVLAPGERKYFDYSPFDYRTAKSAQFFCSGRMPQA